MDASISPSELAVARRTPTPPLVIDVRRAAAYSADDALIAGALRRNPEEIDLRTERLPTASSVVVYCAHGHEVSREAARVLRDRGIDAAYLEGGLETWKRAGGDLMRKPRGRGTRWITRERHRRLGRLRLRACRGSHDALGGVRRDSLRRPERRVRPCR
jgi:rhodanese-related sulfurtransferase